MKKILRWFNPARFSDVVPQVILFLISITLVFVFLLKPTRTFISTDPPPKIEPITSRLEHLGHKVETGIHLENFHEFDLTNNSFVLNAIVWFKFNPSIISLDTIEKFSFEKGDILKRSKPITKLIGNLVLAQYRIKFKFTTNLNYKVFPLNSHRIFITLTNKSVSPKELIFEASESGLTLSKNMLISGWKKDRHEVITGYSESLLDRNDPTTKIFHPVIIFVLDFIRSGTRQLVVLFIPLLLFLYLMLFSLSLGKDLYIRRSIMSFGSISGIIGYRFVVERVSPKVGYLMFIDHIFNILLFISLLIFIVNLATKDKEYNFARGLLVLIAHSMFLISLYYLCFYWAFEGV